MTRRRTQFVRGVLAGIGFALYLAYLPFAWERDGPWWALAWWTGIPVLGLVLALLTLALTGRRKPPTVPVKRFPREDDPYRGVLRSMAVALRALATAHDLLQRVDRDDRADLVDALNLAGVTTDAPGAPRDWTFELRVQILEGRPSATREGGGPLCSGLNAAADRLDTFAHGDEAAVMDEAILAEWMERHA